MIFGLILRSTEETVYSYDTERKQCQFTDKATEEYYKKNGITAFIKNWNTGQLKQKTAKWDDPFKFHQVFYAYTQYEYDLSRYLWTDISSMKARKSTDKL